MAEPSRKDPPRSASEQITLSSFLDYHRDTLLWKVDGLSREELTRRLVPSTTTLLGLVKHMANVERWWFRIVFADESVETIGDDDDPDADWRIEPSETADDVLALYRDEVDRSRAIVQHASLDDPARRPGREETLRWILVHMIEETARHNGHADILREMIDGSTGD